jgi:ketosteroid isomerase-like protein
MAEVATAPMLVQSSSNSPRMPRGDYRDVTVLAGAKSDVLALSIRPVRRGRTLGKSGIPLVFLAGVLAQTAVSPAYAQMSAASDQEAWQIAEVMAKKFEAAYNMGDVASISNLFVDNAYYFTPGGTVLYGWDRRGIERAIAARIRAGWTKEIVKVTEAHSAGEAVWVTGEYGISGTGENEGKQITGHFAQVITRNGGEWRFRLVIANLKPSQDITGMSEVKGIAKSP